MTNCIDRLVVNTARHNYCICAAKFVTRKFRNQKHDLKGNAIPAGYSRTNAHYASGVNNYLNKLILTIRTISHNSEADFFAFWKISYVNLRFLCRHLLI